MNGWRQQPFLNLEVRVTRHKSGLEERGHLDANHLLRDVHHGSSQPTLQTLGKVAYGLG